MKNIQLSARQLEIITGSLLGDGSLDDKTSKNTRYRVERSIKDNIYLIWNYNEFYNLCNNTYPKYNSNHNSIYFSTKHLPVFTKLGKQWYKNNKKIVPKNIKLTPLTVSVWLYDDGCIDYANPKKEVSVRCRLCTNGFNKKEVEFLCKLLNKTLKLKEYPMFKVSKDRNYYIIFGARKATTALLSYIKNCSLPGIERKTNKFKYLIS